MERQASELDTGALLTLRLTTGLSGWQLEPTNPDEVKVLLHGGRFQEEPSPSKLAGATQATLAGDIINTNGHWNAMVTPA